MAPFFSVVLPTHNRGHFLRESIKSVLTQTFGDFELLVVDDSGSEMTREITRSFSDDRIKYVLNERRQGGAGARNAGIFSARGEWIAFLDDDDIWLPEKLFKMAEKIKSADADVGLLYSGHAFYDFDCDKVKSQALPQHKGWLFHELLYKNIIGGFSSVIIRRDILLKINGLDENFPAFQDGELFVRVAEIAKIDFVREILVYIRVSNEDRISFDRKKKLAAFVQFDKKYSQQIKRCHRLKHRSSARIFAYAVLQRNMAMALRVLPRIFGLCANGSTIVSLARFFRSELCHHPQKARIDENQHVTSHS
ncbi:glycosyltransferase family 2 protein [candidate division KSB1 bacterium]|nr:glycosyltransferase family 2 protein [candidate division KSB1 bacterium]